MTKTTLCPQTHPLQSGYQTSQRLPVFMGVPAGQLKWWLKSGELASVPMTLYRGGLWGSVTKPSWALSGVLTEHHTYKTHNDRSHCCWSLNRQLSSFGNKSIFDSVKKKWHHQCLVLFSESFTVTQLIHVASGTHEGLLQHKESASSTTEQKYGKKSFTLRFKTWFESSWSDWSHWAAVTEQSSQNSKGQITCSFKTALRNN